MNIDLLPLSAFALESSHGADRFVAAAHTLTLRLTPPAFDCARTPPMSGSASVGALLPQPKALLRAAVLPAGGPGLTITF